MPVLLLHINPSANRAELERVRVCVCVCVCVSRPPFLLFSGGMPRASYGDRHCISVIHGKTHVALDFTSRIIDYFVIRDGPLHTGAYAKKDYFKGVNA